MKAGEIEALRDAPTEPKAASDSSVWRPALTITSLAALALILVYGVTFESMVSIWWRSETFAHGFFILPISLYLVWSEKDSLQTLRPMPDWKGILAVAFLGLGWLAARLANVLVVEQYCAVASLIAVIYTVIGAGVSRRVAFPLLFLLFSVPVGEALIPTLIVHTAAFVVWALRLVGIPVLQNGNVLTLSNGVWSVVEACSGLRYLIACITIGLPFAYLTYRSWIRRAAFVALSVAVPVVANWVRAFLIIWLGYASDMKLAVGIDHLIYGWIFYAAVMFLLLWVGSRFRDARRERESPEAGPPTASWPRRRMIAVGAGAAICASLFPMWAVHAEHTETVAIPSSTTFALPERLAGFTAVDSAGGPSWGPLYVGADTISTRIYQGSEGRVTLQVALYRNQRQGAELVSSRNVIVSPEESVWKQIGARSQRASGPGSVDERLLSSTREDLLVWRWYWVGGHHTTSQIWAKVIEGGRKLVGKPTPAAGVVLFTTTGGDVESARRRLDEVSSSVVDEIDSRLETFLQ